MHSLICHPNHLSLAPQIAISCAVTSTAEQGLLLRYQVTGELESIKLPAPTSPVPTDGLWEHTCFEAFIATQGDLRYYEFNLAPSGLWAAYGFDAYRERRAWNTPEAPHSSIYQENTSLILELKLPACALPSYPQMLALDIGVTAVIETQTGALSYWALHHPAAQADFHLRAGFILSHPAK